MVSEKKIGQVFIITGTSASGKSSIASAVLKKVPTLEKLVTFTTREKREGEVDGKDCHFISTAEFERLVKDELMAEHEKYGEHLYGSRKKDVDDLVASGKDILLVLEPKGSLTFIEKFPNAVSFFVKAPSVEELRKRMVIRGDEQDKIVERIRLVERDLAYEKKFNFVVVNEVLDTAVEEVLKVIKEKISEEKDKTDGANEKTNGKTN